MLRKKAVAIALSMLMPSLASALGLGALKSSSALNQPFDGRIEILGATAADYDTLSVKLADTQQFDRAGVLREAVLLSLKFEIVETPAGNDYIRITTRDPVREPFLNFLLELNWANGRMVREYTVLLDPPLYDPNRRAPAYTPAPRPVAAAPVAPAAAAPAAAPTAMAPPAMAPMASDGTLGTVQSSDTAWGLAMRHRPDAGVSVQRMMIALLRANPDAFSNNNVNQLRRGAVLRMPSQSDIDGLSQSEALAEVARQHQLWEDYRQGATSAAPAQPMGAATSSPAADSPADDALDEALAAADDVKPKDDDARLELVAPDSAEDTAGAPGAGDTAPADSDATDGDTAEALAAEDQTTRASADAELQAKLDEASEIIDLLQRQVEIKDEELASLQARLAELGVESPPTSDAATADLPSAGAAGEATDAGVAETPAVAETPVETQVETPGADTAPETAPAAEQPATSAPPPVAAAPETPKPVVRPTPAVTPPPAGVLDSLIPAHLRDAVPGGAVTIVGVLGSLLLLVLAFVGKALAGRGGKAITPSARPAAAAATATAAATAVAPAAADTALPLVDSVTPETGDVADQFTRTLEATSEQLQGDPLEEVNVYLAYERFDQAEELVKQVITQYPNEHKYKLRLLEIYYSANNKQAYETHARELLDAVGDHHPLWENAVAMWAEMSPSRALFAPGATEATVTGAAGATEFVDVTGEATSPGGGTMTMGPGDDDGPLAVTAVGLSNDYAGDDSVLDFDLTSTSTDADYEPMLDLTTGESAAGDNAGDNVIDLTATVEQLEKSGFLDLTDADSKAADNDIFDISALEAGVAEAGESAPDFDLGERSDADTADLLDITKTGNVAFEPDESILSITAGSLADTASGAARAPDAPSADDDALNLDFDISDTVAPRLDTEAGPDVAALDVDTDITSRLPPEEPLDFDIEGLGLELDSATATADDEFDLTAEGDEFSLDLDAEAGADLDLSLQNPALDMQINDGLAATSGGAAAGDDESDIEFDLALQDTTDFDKLDVDDTLELPKSSTARLGAEPMAESLEDLTRSMEASLAGLDLDEEPVEDGLLDLDLGTLDSESIDLDFSIDDGSLDNAHDTLAIDHDDLTLERTGMHIDKTVVMPRDDSVEYQSESDEVDTKLNLAKAYIELGDSDGARAILDEVTREGTDGQQQEAQQLLSQLS